MTRAETGNYFFLPKAADKIAGLPSLFPVGLLLDVVWFRRIRRVLFRNDFVELIFLNGFLFTIC